MDGGFTCRAPLATGSRDPGLRPSSVSDVAPPGTWVIEGPNRRPELGKFFRHCWGPDELFLQRTVMLSPMAEDVSNHNL